MGMNRPKDGLGNGTNHIRRCLCLRTRDLVTMRAVLLSAVLWSSGLALAGAAPI